MSSFQCMKFKHIKHKVKPVQCHHLEIPAMNTWVNIILDISLGMAHIRKQNTNAM